jgi:hypothetical protein
MKQIHLELSLTQQITPETTEDVTPAASDMHPKSEKPASQPAARLTFKGSRNLKGGATISGRFFLFVRLVRILFWIFKF